MNAESQPEPDYRSSNFGEALYFDSGDHRLFAWLHQSDRKAQPTLGLLICKPFGHEAIYSHAGMRAFADAAAAIGVPAMRFDYSGTGDSADMDAQTDQLDVWSRDIVAAVEELQRRTGVERVCLLGIRLGGLLALQTARRCQAVSALILVSPVIRGKKYLRELRTTSLASILGVTEPTAAPGGADGASTSASSDGELEVAGFSLSAASRAALSQADFTTTQAPVPDMLIIDGNSLPTTRRWAEVLCASEARTTYLSLPGLIEMIMTPPHLGSVPQEMIGAARDWLARYLASLQPQLAGGAGARLRETEVASSASLSIPNPDLSLQATVTEKPVFFGPEALLFGIITEPSQGEKRRGAVILLNAGGSYHVGASRMYVPLARRWARRGYVVLRMDYSGLGDSGVRPGQRWDDIFPADAIAEIRAGIKLLENQYGVRDVSLAGLCAGAYHALHAAIAALPVSRVLMVNPIYYWNDERALEDVQKAELIRDTGAYGNRTLSFSTWKRLLQGQVNVRFVFRTYSHRLYTVFGVVMRDLARRMRIHLSRDLGWELEEVAARGVRLIFVFAPGEPGLDLLNLQAGASLRRLGERCRVHVLESGDHVFSKSGPREVLADILSDELDTRYESTGVDPTYPPLPFPSSQKP
jgi:alpha-beta hydrolase superfamily lysophospholipase